MPSSNQEPLHVSTRAGRFFRVQALVDQDLFQRRANGRLIVIERDGLERGGARQRADGAEPEPAAAPLEEHGGWNRLVARVDDRDRPAARDGRRKRETGDARAAIKEKLLVLRTHAHRRGIRGACRVVIIGACLLREYRVRSRSDPDVAPGQLVARGGGARIELGEQAVFESHPHVDRQDVRVQARFVNGLRDRKTGVLEFAGTRANLDDLLWRVIQGVSDAAPRAAPAGS